MTQVATLASGLSERQPLAPPNPSFLPFNHRGADSRSLPDVNATPAECRLAAIGIVRRFAAGTTIHLEGEPSHHCYKVLSGLVKELNTLNDGRCQIAGFRSDGDLFAMTCRGTYQHTAEAINETLLVCYPRDRFFEIVSEYPSVFSCLIADVMAQLNSARQQAILLGRMTATERVAAFLVQLSDIQDSKGAHEEIRIDMSRQDIADYLGLTNETVCRVLTRLKNKKIICMQSPYSIKINLKEELTALLHKR